MDGPEDGPARGVRSESNHPEGREPGFPSALSSRQCLALAPKPKESSLKRAAGTGNRFLKMPLAKFSVSAQLLGEIFARACHQVGGISCQSVETIAVGHGRLA